MSRITLLRVWAVLLALVLVFPAFTAVDDEARLRDLQTGNAPVAFHANHSDSSSVSFEEVEQGLIAAPFSLLIAFSFFIAVVLFSSRVLSTTAESASSRGPPLFA